MFYLQPFLNDVTNNSERVKLLDITFPVSGGQQEHAGATGKKDAENQLM
jgi:hypothetical protein